VGRELRRALEDGGSGQPWRRGSDAKKVKALELGDDRTRLDIRD
jgi:hypothetical protein